MLCPVVKFIKMSKLNMFITAVCFLFLIKLYSGPRTTVFTLQSLNNTAVERNIIFLARKEMKQTGSQKSTMLVLPCKPFVSRQS